MLPLSRPQSLGMFAGCCVMALLSGVSTPVAAAPIVIEYGDFYYEDRTRTISNRATLEPSTFPTPTIMQLSRFDPALGTLLSVALDLSVEIFGQMDTHCVSPISCNTDATAFVGSGLYLADASAQLGVDLGPNLAAATSGQRDCSFTTFPVADCARQWIGRDSDSRHMTFTGTDMEGFVGTIPFHFIALGLPHISTSLSHSGFPNLGAGGPSNVDAAGGLTFSGLGPDLILALLEVSYELFLNDVFLNHNIAYSDAHLYANELLTARVRYTYEPVSTSVPEPHALFLLALAAGTSYASRRRRQKR